MLGTRVPSGYETNGDRGRPNVATSPHGSASSSCESWYENRSRPEFLNAGRCALPTTPEAPPWPRTPHLDGPLSSSRAATRPPASRRAIPYTQVTERRARVTSGSRPQLGRSASHWSGHTTEAMTERAKTPGQEWWQAPADIWKTAQDEQEARYTPDPWEEPIWDWLNSRSRNRVTVGEVLRLCLGITADKVDQNHANRMAGIFQRLGWGKVRRRDGERKRRRWAYEKV
jgi:hypothetical protein